MARSHQKKKVSFTLRFSTPGQTATGTQVGPSGSIEFLNFLQIFHREILFMVDLNSYLCLLFVCKKNDFS